MTEVNLLYNVHHQEAFGLWIALYFYLTGLSAGSFIISTMAYVFGMDKFKPLGKIGVVLATILLVMAPACLLLHAGKTLRFWHLLVYINFASPLSWGTFRSGCLITTIACWPTPGIVPGWTRSSGSYRP